MTINCQNCFHKDVCSNTVLRMTVLEYGSCDSFLDKSKVIIKPDKEPYFTPEQVRAMTRDEVRVNYYFILESMKKWNEEITNEN